MRAMLRSTLSMSMTAQGVPYSRAILAARAVVMFEPVQSLRVALQVPASDLRPRQALAARSQSLTRPPQTSFGPSDRDRDRQADAGVWRYRPAVCPSSSAGFRARAFR